MALLEWKKKEEIDPYSGVPTNWIFFSSIQKSLNYIAMHKNLKKNSWSLSMIKKVFYGTAKPGRDLLIALKSLTGLSDEEILNGGKNVQTDK